MRYSSPPPAWAAPGRRRATPDMLRSFEDLDRPEREPERRRRRSRSRERGPRDDYESDRRGGGFGRGDRDRDRDRDDRDRGDRGDRGGQRRLQPPNSTVMIKGVSSHTSEHSISKLLRDYGDVQVSLAHLVAG